MKVIVREQRSQTEQNHAANPNADGGDINRSADPNRASAAEESARIEEEADHAPEQNSAVRKPFRDPDGFVAETSAPIVAHA
ncbi:hypothetical protein [Bradyrhizobium sp. CIR3A]|uniref:hypothetical protein n=1 Tax=Bradyrhizobium sp. CIR3A TaxID=2663838 RepID=UPI00160566D5|nr:hypothetical protein [Bradyrhizobium sp. CIR3A]MBB4258047.1 hypothetical protein [Bradyrhizobium sp. CIR3A]